MLDVPSNVEDQNRMTTIKRCCHVSICLIGLVTLLGLYGTYQYKGRELRTVDKQNRDSTEAIIGQRISHVEDMCQRQTIPLINSDTRQQFLIHRPLRMSMCYVPKAGCTFWKRVFIGLQRNLTDIFRVTKMEAHITPIDRLAKMPTYDEAHDFLLKSRRIIFVRDPYSRLYSAYEDKLFLGDFFENFGKAIVRHIRAKPSKESLRCGHDVTFEEFLKYVLLVSKKPYRGGGDEHWIPITSLCHPCTFNFDIIGKMETFAQDRDYIFKTIGINIVSESKLSRDSIVRDTMKQTIDMIWDKRSNCLSVVENIQRMWESYQSQGNIHTSIDFPKDKVSEETTRNEFLHLAMEAYKMRPMSSQERKEQRKLALRSAYSSISLKTLQEIQETFHLDFTLFQYPIEPNELLTMP